MATVAGERAPASRDVAVAARRRAPSWILLILSLVVVLVLAAPLVFLIIEVRDAKGNRSEAVLEIRYRRLRILPPAGKAKRSS